MDINDIVSGRLSISLPSLKDLVLKIPTRGNIMRYQLEINAFCDALTEEYQKSGFVYHDVDAEKDILKKYPDFYEVMEVSEKKKRDIILSMDANETPDERFIKTPDEIAKMSVEEKTKYSEYYKKQYYGFYDKLLADKDIVKATHYMEDKAVLYSTTLETRIKEVKRIYWMAVTAEKPDGTLYFNNFKETSEIVLGLPYPEYIQLMDMWNGIVDGFGLPF